ncbi:MAG: hypothetical protein RBG13Loki_1004 [Promethearchaeota archaeon CR_4]|nr:MAG: hypothetical protein RBG13Loki_1004 [Candidatus Lokiarchaeota archaeon CR_4]
MCKYHFYYLPHERHARDFHPLPIYDSPLPLLPLTLTPYIIAQIIIVKVGAIMYLNSSVANLVISLDEGNTNIPLGVTLNTWLYMLKVWDNTDNIYPMIHCQKKFTG